MLPCSTRRSIGCVQIIFCTQHRPVFRPSFVMFLRSVRPTLFLLASFLIVNIAAAQEVVPPPKEKPSPLAMTYKMLDDGTYIKITYHSPRKRGRTIFGDLEPYGELWRLGANEATEITVTQDVMFGDEKLLAGTYTLFAHIDENNWDIIVNTDLNQWGDYSYDDSKNILRYRTQTQSIDEIYEAFTMSLEDAEGGTNLTIMWDQTKVIVPIKGAAM